MCGSIQKIIAYFFTLSEAVQNRGKTGVYPLCDSITESGISDDYTIIINKIHKGALENVCFKHYQYKFQL